MINFSNNQSPSCGAFELKCKKLGNFKTELCLLLKYYVFSMVETFVFVMVYVA